MVIMFDDEITKTTLEKGTTVIAPTYIKPVIQPTPIPLTEAQLDVFREIEAERTIDEVMFDFQTHEEAHIKIIERELEAGLEIPLGVSIGIATSIAETIRLNILKAKQLKESDTKAYYKQFSIRELAYIYNSLEITHEYAHSILQSKTVNPLNWLGNLQKFEDYQRRPTKFTSLEILNIENKYKGYTMEDFYDLVITNQWSNDKARYVMFKLGIYDFDAWNKLTGHVGKGSLFWDEVINNVIVKPLGVITDTITDVFELTLDNLLGENWKTDILLYGSVAIGLIIGIVLLVYYAKTRMIKSAISKGVETTKQIKEVIK